MCYYIASPYMKEKVSMREMWPIPEIDDPDDWEPTVTIERI